MGCKRQNVGMPQLTESMKSSEEKARVSVLTSIVYSTKLLIGTKRRALFELCSKFH